VQELFTKLPAKEDLTLNRLVGVVLSIPQIKDVAIDSATTTANGAEQNVLDAPAGKLRIAGFPTVLGDLQIVDPSLPTRLNVSIQGPPNASLLNKNAIETALSAAVTYLNAVNAAELAPGAPAGEAARRVLSFDKLLTVIPVPASAAATDLKSIDDTVAAGGTPTLRTDADLQGFKIQFVFTTSAGASQILSRSADPPYTLQPFEQLTVSGVQVPG
jgi:hypothetical protein